MKSIAIGYLTIFITLFSYSCNLEVIEDLIPDVPVSVSYTTNCYDLSFEFTTEIQPTQISWDFGDGNNSSEPSPVHKFNPGNYQVNLVVSDGQYLGDTTFTVNIPYATFLDRFGTILDEAEGIGVLENSKGNFIALGNSFNTFYGLEITPCGEEIKFTSLAMENNIAPGEMIGLSNGNYALTGFNNGGLNGFIFLVDESLNLASVNNIPAPAGEMTYYSDIIETSTNELVISGSKFGNGWWGLTLHKSNLSAQTITGPRLYNSNEIGAGPLIESTAGGFIMIYRSFSGTISTISYATFNSSFENPQSVVIKARPSDDDQFSVVDAELVESENILIFGTVRNSGASTVFPYLFKIDNGGDEIYFEEFDNSDFDNTIEFGLSLQFEILEDGYLFGGVNTNETNFYLFKTNLGGIVQWDRVYSINSGSYLRDILLASDGGYVLIGGEEGALDDEIIIIKTDNNGNI